MSSGWTLGGSNSWSEPKASSPVPNLPGGTPDQSSATSPETPASSSRPSIGSSPGNQVVGIASGKISVDNTPLENLRIWDKSSLSFKTIQEQSSPAAQVNLLQLYYAYFHNGHPFILPPAHLLKRMKDLSQLIPVLKYVGSCYAQKAPHDSFKQAANYTLFHQNAPKNGYTVQALLLFGIALHSANEQERSCEVMTHAIDMALDLGMNRKEYAVTYGEGDSVLEESWRRTWWELYYIDGLIAGVHQRTSFRLFSEPSDVPLPCEEWQYLSGKIPPPRSVQEFDERHFAKDEVVYSSFAYRIDAVRILGRVLEVGQDSNPENPMADAADACLVTWALHLPDEKKELLIAKDGKIDEMLFQAHMVINATTVFLHRPRSHLAYTNVSDDTSCTPPRSYGFTQNPLQMHTAKAIRAADTISRLIALPTPLIRHTPFLTCVITLGAIVHLSACSFILFGDDGFIAKERIRLGVGALKVMKDVWAVAGCVLEQVKGVAREVFALPKPRDLPSGQVVSEEEIMMYIDSDHGLDDIMIGEVDYYGLPALEWNGQDGLPDIPL